MKLHFQPTHPHRERGLTLLEVLITIVILAFGLLGIAGLQARMQVAEIESYQRAQAIVLLQDMVDRINANRRNAMSYVTASPVGTDGTLDCSAPATVAAKDLCEWNDALLGATEVKSGGTCTSADPSGCIGAMIDARGCVINTAATMPREFLVSVVWQGLAPTAAPPAGITCGSGSYSPDTTRRAIVARVKIGCLQNDSGGVTCLP